MIRNSDTKVPFRHLFRRTTVVLACSIIALEVGVLSIVLPTPNYATLGNGLQNKVSILLNDKNVTPKNPPVVIKGTLMVPAQQMFQSLGIQTNALSNENVLIGYRNNVFLKFEGGVKSAFRNGKAVRLTETPVKLHNVLYVPLDFIISSYGYHYTEDKNVLYLKSPDSNGRFTLLDNVYYKTMNVPSLDVNFSIPDYWQKKDKSGLKYGYKDDLQNITLEITSYRTMVPDISAVIEGFITTRLGPQSEMAVQTVEKIRVSDLDAAAITSTRKLGFKNDHTIDYLIKQGNTVFHLHFKSQGKASTADSKGIVKNIAKSFKVNNLSVDYTQEYYVEYDNYYKYDFKPASEIYSSQLVDSQLAIKGTVQTNLPYKKLIAIVTKDKQYSTFTLPVKNGKFSGKIYTPFGLGMHNVTIVMAPPVLSSNSYPQLVNDPKAKVVEFSIINTATRDIKFLIPSSKINSDDPEIVNLANLKTYKSLNRLDKARNLYKWVSDNIVFDRRSAGRSAIDVFQKSHGSEEEINFLYAALLRATGTPSRVVKGDMKGHSTYWTEMQLNGTWVVSDIVRGIQVSSTTGDISSSAYFSQDLRQYYEKRENISRLDF